MRSQQEIYDLLLGFAQKDPRIRGVLLNGSRTNPAAPLDSFRDYDIVYLVTEVAPYKTGDLSPAFGDVLVMQRTDESQLYQEHFPELAIYLMQFTDGTRIDLTIAPKEHWKTYVDREPTIVLLDKDGFLPQLPLPDGSAYGVERPSAQIFQECRNEFWWTAPYVSKGLWRDQLLYAQHILETCTRPMLRLMLSWMAGGERGFPIHPGKAGDGLQAYLPPQVWEQYLATYAPCHKGELFQALDNSCRLFIQASHRAGDLLGYTWKDRWEETVPPFMNETQRKLAALPLCPLWEGELLHRMGSHPRKEQA